MNKLRLLGLMLTCSAFAPCLVNAQNKADSADVYGKSCIIPSTNEWGFGAPMLLSGRRPSHALREGENANGTISVTVFGGKLSRSEELARYFSPTGSQSFSVVESRVVTPVPTPPGFELDGAPLKVPLTSRAELIKNRAINTQHFNIETVNGDFESRVSFCPEHTYVGATFTWLQALGFDDCGMPQYWLGVNLPVVRVRNKMNLTETIINDGGGVETRQVGLNGAPYVGSFKEAMKQSAMKYGKIDDSRCLEETKVADLEIILGYSSVCSPCSELSGYFGFIVPTSNATTAEYMFEPTVAYGDAFGIQLGAHIDFLLYQWDCADIVAYVDTNTRYYFSKKQVRSFDLKNRPWSRYMAVWTSLEEAQAAVADPAGEGARAGSFGINTFTQEVDVTPRATGRYTTTLAYERQNFNIEAGYSFFARQAEKIELCSFPNTIALKDVGSFNDDNGGGVVDVASTISAYTPIAFSVDNVGAITPLAADGPNGAENYEFARITRDDLDLNSAAQPVYLLHTIYGAFTYSWDCFCYPVYATAGASYSFSDTNVGVQRWAAWGKIGISF